MWNDPGSPWHAQTGGASIVRLQISVWGGKRQREDGYYVGKRKMLCWATEQKVSDSLFPIQSGRSQEGRLVMSRFWGPADSLGGGGGGRPAARWTKAGRQRAL